MENKKIQKTKMKMKSITFQNFIDCQNAGAKNALRQNKCIGRVEESKRSGSDHITWPIGARRRNARPPQLQPLER